MATLRSRPTAPPTSLTAIVLPVSMDQAPTIPRDRALSFPKLVPDSNPAPGIVDPSIGIGANGTVYYGYANSNGAPSIAVGHKINHQIIWAPSKDVGSALGIQN